MIVPRFADWCRCLLALCLLAPAVLAAAQMKPPAPVRHHAESKQPAKSGPAHVVMLSDIHFDPFRDPAKLPRLRATPIEGWPAILEAPASATQAADLQHLQQSCAARGLDSAWPLFKRSLEAMRDEEARPAFVTVSGDLLTHQFECRFRSAVVLDATPRTPPPDDGTPAPPAPRPPTEDEIVVFAAKTIDFVAQQLRQNFPGTPIYLALGNNDAGCSDYHETPDSPFLHAFAKSAASTATDDPALRSALVTEASALGDYAVELPAPMQHTRLIVLQNIFESAKYNNCKTAADRTPEKQQIAWLRAQLADARAHGEHAWVMAHIPPGVDVYSSFHSYVLAPQRMCSAPLTSFLDTSVVPFALNDTVAGFSDVVSLALFAHTHMDEIRVLRSADGTHIVASKQVPSISPVNGNHPAFMVADVDPATATLRDWRTMVSPAPEGSAPPWTEGYRFSTLYHLPDLSALSADKLTLALVNDRTGTTAASESYRHHYYAGDPGLFSMAIGQIWPAYACAMREERPEAFHQCLCPAAAVKPAE